MNLFLSVCPAQSTESGEKPGESVTVKLPLRKKTAKHIDRTLKRIYNQISTSQLHIVVLRCLISDARIWDEKGSRCESCAMP